MAKPIKTVRCHCKKCGRKQEHESVLGPLHFDPEHPRDKSMRREKQTRTCTVCGTVDIGYLYPYILADIFSI